LVRFQGAENLGPRLDVELPEPKPQRSGAEPPQAREVAEIHDVEPSLG
jgi:hypothetical protein